MANLKSSKKDIRRIEKRTEVSRAVKTSLKTYIKRVREAVETGEQPKIQEALDRAQKMLDKAVKRGIIHKNQGSRRKSRMAQLVVKASQAPQA